MTDGRSLSLVMLGAAACLVAASFAAPARDRPHAFPVGPLSTLALDLPVADADARALEGAHLRPMAGEPGIMLIVRGTTEIGRVVLTAPAGAIGQALCAPDEAMPPSAIRAKVRLGDRAGNYSVIVRLHSGAVARVVLQVHPDAAMDARSRHVG